jgi:hypothetical protein
VEGAHSGHSAVQRDEQVEGLRLTDLADDDAGRSHPQRLLDQAAKGDLTGAFQARLAALHARDVAQRDLELEHLLAGHHALARRDGGGETVQKRRLAGLGSARHEDVEPGDDAGLEEPRGLRCEGAEPDEVLGGRRAPRICGR